MALKWHDLGNLKGPKGDAGPTTAATSSKIGAVKPGAGMRVDNTGTLGLNIGDGLTLANDILSATATAGRDGTQVKVIKDTDTLPTGLPTGSVVIQVAADKLTFYTEDGKTA